MSDALTSHTKLLVQAEADLKACNEQKLVIEARVRECRHSVEKITIDKRAAELKANPVSVAPIQFDDATLALLAGLRNTLNSAGQQVSWQACDERQVEALRTVLDLAASHTEKQELLSAASVPVPNAGVDCIDLTKVQPPHTDTCRWLYW